MLETLLKWWAAQLLGLLPAGAAGARDGGLVAELLPDGRACVSVRRRGRDAALGTFALDGAGRNALIAAVAPFRRTPVLLRVPAGLALERDVSLPLAAERNLQQVLGFEMDRLTPFPAGAVHWSSTVLRRDRAQGRIMLRLSLMPKARLAGLLDALDAAGAVPGAIEVPVRGAAGEARRIVLRGAAGAARWQRGVLAGLGGTCAVLAVAAVALPFILQSARLAAAEDRIAALRPRVDQVEALRRRLASGSADGDAVAAERARLGDALGVVAALTAVLPDDTFLTDFALRGGQVTVSGQSGAAVRLIGAIAADPVFRNPAFTAPVTRAEGAKARDVFSLRVDAAADGGDPAAPPGR